MSSYSCLSDYVFYKTGQHSGWTRQFTRLKLFFSFLNERKSKPLLSKYSILQVFFLPLISWLCFGAFYLWEQVKVRNLNFGKISFTFKIKITPHIAAFYSVELLSYIYCVGFFFVSLNVACYLSQAPSEYEANPEMLFYRITHLSRGKQYHIWAAAVTTAGRGNMSSKVIVEPAGKGGSCRPACSGGTIVGTS